MIKLLRYVRLGFCVASPQNGNSGLREALAMMICDAIAIIRYGPNWIDAVRRAKDQRRSKVTSTETPAGPKSRLLKGLRVSGNVKLTGGNSAHSQGLVARSEDQVRWRQSK
jgi:hypothetical protein